MKYFLAVINGFLALGIIAWPLAFIWIGFLFDAPGSSDSIITIAIAVSILSYPVPTILGIILFWQDWKSNNTVKLLMYTVVTSLGYLAIIISIMLLNLVCDGRFACD